MGLSLHPGSISGRRSFRRWKELCKQLDRCQLEPRRGATSPIPICTLGTALVQTNQRESESTGREENKHQQDGLRRAGMHQEMEAEKGESGWREGEAQAIVSLTVKWKNK